MTGIKAELFARMDELSPAERKVARSLLANYPSAGLSSAAALARAAGTSTPTVLRLVARIGLVSYPEFQERLREEITQQLSSPVTRAEQGLREDGGSSVFQRSVARRAGMVERLLVTVPPGEFEAAVSLLAGRPKGVVVSGGYFSRHIARILATQLDQLLPGVAFAAEPLGQDVGRYLGLGKDSVAIVLDLRRYELPSRQAALMARKRGASVIVITDEELSPATESADVVLPIPVGGIPFDSFSALVVLVESLVEATFHRAGDRSLRRMREWDASMQVHRASRPDATPTASPGRVGP